MEKGKWKKILLAIMLFSVVFFASCSCSIGNKDVAVRSLTISASKLDVKINDEFSLSYTVAPIETSITGVYVSVTNANVIGTEITETTENSGEIIFTALKAGKSDITIVTKDGEFSKTCAVEVFDTSILSTPTNISFDGEKLVWDKVTTDLNGLPRNAEEMYAVIIKWEDKEEILEVATNNLSNSAKFSFLTDVQYEVSVQALGDDVKNYNSETSEIYTFYILSAPSLNVQNGIINWREHYSNNESFVRANYFILNYNQDGDYIVVGNGGNIYNNFYDIRQQSQPDYAVTVRAINSNLTRLEMEDAIDDYMQDPKGALIFDVDGVNYVMSKSSQESVIHPLKEPTNFTMTHNHTQSVVVDGVTIASSYMPSKIQWEGQVEQFKNKVRYVLVFFKDELSRSVTLQPGVEEFEFTSEFIKNILIDSLNVSFASPEFSLEINTQLASIDDLKYFIQPRRTAPVDFEHLPLTGEDFNLTLENNIIKLTQPAHFPNLQFIFVNEEKKQSVTALPTNGEINIASLLSGMDGQFKIYANARGESDTVINTINVNFPTISLQKLLVEGLEVVKVDENYFLSWQDNALAQTYKISGLGEDKFLYSQIDRGDYYNETAKKWQYPISAPTAGEIIDISLTAVAKDSTQYEWYFDSDATTIQVAQFPEVVFGLMDRTVSWTVTAINPILNRNNGFSLEVINSDTSEIVLQNDIVFQQNSYNTSSLPAGDYQIKIVAKGALKTTGSSLYVLNSDVSIYDFTKLNTVTIGVENGKLSWNRTVEGNPNTVPHTIADQYIVYRNGEVFNAQISEEDGKMVIILQNDVQTNSMFTVVVKRPADAKNYVLSDESEQLLVKTISVKNFKKEGDNFEFEPTMLVNSQDVAAGYCLTGTHSENDDYSYEELYIEANGEYFVDGKYVIPVSPLVAGAGEYAFKIATVGNMFEEVAYLGRVAEDSLTVVQLDNPAINQITVDRGEFAILKYSPASSSSLDKPVSVEVSFYQGDELYNEPIIYTYNNFNFGTASIIKLSLPSQFELEAGSYDLFVKFIGDGNNYVLDSERVLVNNETAVYKLEEVSVYIENGELKWESHPLASKYLVTLNSANAIDVEDNFLSTDSWSAGTTTVKVVAYADNYLMSNPSDVFTAKKLNSPKLSANEMDGSKVISWNVIEGVSGYDLYKEDGDSVLIAQPQTAYWQVNRNEQVGSAYYSVIAKGTADTRSLENKLTGCLDSNASSIFELKFITPTLETSIEKGLLTWNAVSGVLSYKVDLFDYSTYLSNKQLKHTTTINATTFDANQFESIMSGAYMLEVSVNKVNATSNVVVSIDENNYTHTLPIIKIDNLGGTPIYDNLRVEEGKFAFDITDEFLSNYSNQLSDINPTKSSYYSSYINLSTLAEILVQKDHDDDSVLEILYPLINFNVYLKYNDNNVIKLSRKMPSGFAVNAGYITLYYEIDGPAGTYGIEFEQLGNTSNNTEVIGVIDGKKTAPLNATKAGQPLSPISEGGRSISNGKLIWAYPAAFNDDFIIELTDENNEVLIKTVTVGDVIDPDNPWQAVKVNNIITLDLVTCVTGNELKEGINYSIAIYAKGTVDSTVDSGEIYLNGEVNNIEPMFRVLEQPENFIVEGGYLYWESVEGASGYSLTFYLHNGTSYELIDIDGMPNIMVDKSKNIFSLQNVDGVVHGNYKIELRAVGNDENIINLPSRVASLYAVKLDEVAEVYVQDGRFAFEEIFYDDIDPSDGSILNRVAVDTYFVTVVERRDGRIIDSMFIGEQNLVSEDGVYLVELDDIFSKINSDYRVEVYASGNDEYLLSGNVVVSDYLMRSIAPTHFTIDEDGLITWTETADYYVVFISETRVQFDEEGENRGYTENNYFNINDYIKSIYGEYNRIYSFYVRALNDNADKDEQHLFQPIIRSERAGNLNLYIMEMPTVRLENGDINWQSNIYKDIKENIAQSFLTIEGNFLINGHAEYGKLTVLCSVDNAIFENKEYIVENRGQGEFYIDMANMPSSGDTLVLIDNEEYEMSLEYIGNTGTALPNRTTFVTSDVLVVDGFISQTRPTGLESVSGEMIENDISNNFILWSPIADNVDYRIKTYGYNGGGDLVFVKAYETVDYDQPYTGVYDGKIYFAVDEIINYFSTNGYGQVIRYEIVAKGENWNKGVGNKILSSVPSEAIEVDYPLAPTEFHYDGKGAISWLNSSNGEVVIEVKYKVETGAGYYDIDNFVNNFSDEIISREVEDGYAIDTIEVAGQERGRRGYYQLKYLTSDIEYIKIKTRSEGLNSSQLRLDKKADGTLSQGYAVFQLFYGGDGSAVAPFVIKDRASLYNINHYLDSHFMLANDITLSTPWTPIGSAGNTGETVYEGVPSSFTGTFDGKDYVIYNVNLQGEDETVPGRKYAGLFYEAEKTATIKNLSVEFVSNNIAASKINLVVGGLVAKANYGRIENIKVWGTLIADGSTEVIYANYLAAITYENYGEITSCLSSVSIRENNGQETYTGGIAVSNFNKITKSGVTLTGESLSGTTVGGIVAINYGLVDESFFDGKLIVNSANFSGHCYFGGIAAIAEVNTEEAGASNISKCYAIVSSEVRRIKLGFDCFGGGLVGSTKSIDNQLEFGYVTFKSHLALNNDGGVKVGIVYGQYISGGTVHIYYPNQTTSIKEVYGSGNVPGGVINRNNVDDCVIYLNSNIGDVIFRNDGKGHPSLHWEDFE